MVAGIDRGSSARWIARLGGGLALFGVVFGTGAAAQEVAGAQDETEEAAAGGQDEAAIPEAEVAPAAPGYHRLEDYDRLLAAWRGTGLLEPIELGVASAGGRELHIVQFGAPGPTPLGERPAVLLVGGLDGVSVAGSEAVLALVGRLLAQAEALPPEVAILAVPWGNPDGLAPRLENGANGGGNDRKIDDDRDGKVNEDGPDDLDGDGHTLEMLVEDPEGPWVRAGDARFLRPARAGEAPRYRRVPEGRDDDGDGRYNEDGRGGVLLEHNFPVAWDGPWCGVESGPWPLSEPCSRALADLALSRPLLAVLVFQGHHGALATPGGIARGEATGSSSGPLPRAEDEPAFRALHRLFVEATGRNLPGPLRLAEAHGRSMPGAPLDWFYTALGIPSVEIGVWGPSVDGPDLAGRAVREGRYGPVEDESATLAGVRSEDRQWAGWLDDTRGGIGFVDWQPVELGDGRRALVGGWEPRTRLNPPPDVLPRVLEGLDTFTLALLQRLPRLEIEVRDTGRDGTVARLRARLCNGGGLPTGAGPRSSDRMLHLALELPEGVSLLAGEAAVDLEHLPGGATSRELEWLFAAPEGAVIRLRASSSLCLGVTREVKL